MATSRKLVVVESAEKVASSAADIVLAAARDAIAERGMFAIALAGGSTPRRLYRRLASSHADFAHWSVYFGDERWVAPADPDSNLRMAREALLDHVPIPPRQVHPIDTTAGSPAKAALLYAMTIRRTLACPPAELPRFDLVLLGLGADGHTASLFPGSTALAAAPHDLVVAAWAPGPRAWRVTLTAAFLSAARAVVFLVSGADKAEALARVMRSDVVAADPGTAAQAPPAASIQLRPDASLTFVVDRDAARLLRSVP